MDQEKSVKEALKKCAVGLSASETVEEFTVSDDGEMKLVKRKVTKRDIPPDLKAVKMLLLEDENFGSDEELLAERSKLLELLKEEKYD